MIFHNLDNRGGCFLRFLLKTIISFVCGILKGTSATELAVYHKRQQNIMRIKFYIIANIIIILLPKFLSAYCYKHQYNIRFAYP